MAEPKLRADTLISALIGGIAGGLVVYWITPAPTAHGPSADAAHSAGSHVGEAAPGHASHRVPDATKKRLARLETSLRRVQQRVTEQAKVDVYQEGGGGGAADGSGDDKGKRITLSAADPKFQSAVRAVIDGAKWEEEQAEQDKRDDRRDRRIETQVEELTTELSLSGDQADQVEIVLQSRAETLRSLRDSDDRPVTRRDWRTKFIEVQASARKKLTGILDADQLTAYDKLQDERGFGPWGARPQAPPN